MVKKKPSPTRKKKKPSPIRKKATRKNKGSAPSAKAREARPGESPRQTKTRLRKNKERREARAALRDAHESALDIAHEAQIVSDRASRLVVRGRRNGPEGFKPTLDQRRAVTMMAGLGQPHDQIAILTTDDSTGLPISVKTLQKRFAHELESGPAVIGAKIGQTLLQKAVGNGAGSVTAAIFMARTRLGWQEKTVVEIEARAGVLIPPAAMSPLEWVKAMQDKAELAEEPGAADREE